MDAESKEKKREQREKWGGDGGMSRERERKDMQGSSHTEGVGKRMETGGTGGGWS